MFLGGRVRAEQAGNAAAMQGVDDHHLRRRGMRFGGLERQSLRITIDLPQRVGKSAWIAGDFSAATVGTEFTAA